MPVKTTDQVSNEPRLSISTDGMPLASCLRYVSDRCHVSVIAAAGLDDKLIVLDVIDQPVSQVLGVIARRIGVQVTRIGSLYFLGELRPEDRGVFVRKVERLSREELNSAVSVLLSEHGRVITYDDGLVLVGDRVEVLQRISELFDSVESAPAESWVVQLHLISLRDRASQELGLDVNPTGELAFRLAGIDAVDFGFSVDSMFSALLKASKESDGVTLVAQPMFVLLDGSPCEFVSGDEVRIAESTVSPEGTVTTTGYEAPSNWPDGSGIFT